jgi:hypothetical protein
MTKTVMCTATQSEEIRGVDKSIRNWLIVFALTAAVSLVSALAENQSILATAGMVVAAAAIVLYTDKREKLVEEASLVRVAA